MISHEYSVSVPWCQQICQQICHGFKEKQAENDEDSIEDKGSSLEVSILYAADALGVLGMEHCSLEAGVFWGCLVTWSVWYSTHKLLGQYYGSWSSKKLLKSNVNPCPRPYMVAHSALQCCLRD
jgi:hypothetical protein